MKNAEYNFITKAITEGPKHHFFGYYDISPWNKAQTKYLLLETDFHARACEKDDESDVCVVDTETGVVNPISRTRAFNLQQGSMLHWIDVGFGEEITHNDWEDGRLISRVINPDTGDQRTISGAIAGVSPVEPIAIGLNYARMRFCRRVVGYANDLYETETLDPRPKDDGLFLLDLVTGDSKLLISFADIAEVLSIPRLFNQPHWFNHVVFNTDGSRIMFVYRILDPPNSFGKTSSLWTVNTDGSDLQCISPFGIRPNHFAWQDPQNIIATSDILGEMQFIRITDKEKLNKPYGNGLFPPDGHFGFSPDYSWIVCDTYPHQDPENIARLFLYDVHGKKMHLLGEYYHPPHIKDDWRCDLHPRWSPDGKLVSFDSVHESSRQVYVIDLSEITHPND